MIYDKVENSSRYFKAPIFKEIFQKLKDFDINTPNGTYKTHDSYYFKVMSYETQLSPKIIESHRKEVDVQILLSGKELIKIYKEEDVSVLEKYNSKIENISSVKKMTNHKYFCSLLVGKDQDILYEKYSSDFSATQPQK